MVVSLSCLNIITGVLSQDSFNVFENFSGQVVEIRLVFFLSTRIIVNKINATKIN